MNVENLLREEVTSELQELKKMELGTDKYKMTVDGTTKLMDRVIELEKIQMEHDEKVASREAENEIKQAQLKAEKRNNVAKHTIAGISVGVGAIVAGIGMYLDKNGYFPSNIPGKQALSKCIDKIFKI